MTLDQMTREELREAAAIEFAAGNPERATALATLAITAPSGKSTIPPQQYRGIEPERVSAARGDAAMAQGQANIDADDLARHPAASE